MDRCELDSVLLCNLLDYRDIFCIERTLTGVIQDISGFAYTWMFCTFFERRHFDILPAEWKIPQLYAVICFVCKIFIDSAVQLHCCLDIPLETGGVGFTVIPKTVI